MQLKQNENRVLISSLQSQFHECLRYFFILRQTDNRLFVLRWWRDRSCRSQEPARSCQQYFCIPQLASLQHLPWVGHPATVSQCILSLSVRKPESLFQVLVDNIEYSVDGEICLDIEIWDLSLDLRVEFYDFLIHLDVKLLFASSSCTSLAKTISPFTSNIRTLQLTVDITVICTSSTFTVRTVPNRAEEIVCTEISVFISVSFSFRSSCPSCIFTRIWVPSASVLASAKTGDLLLEFRLHIPVVFVLLLRPGWSKHSPFVRRSPTNFRISRLRFSFRRLRFAWVSPGIVWGWPCPWNGPY